MSNGGQEDGKPSSETIPEGRIRLVIGRCRGVTSARRLRIQLISLFEAQVSCDVLDEEA